MYLYNNISFIIIEAVRSIDPRREIIGKKPLNPIPAMEVLVLSSAPPAAMEVLAL